MKLPQSEKAVVPRAKVVHYLLALTHPSGRHKAVFFRGFGFSPDAWEALAAALLQHAREHEVAAVEDSPFGTRYSIEGELRSPHGRRPLVRTVWFVEGREGVPRFVTAYPLERRTS